MGLGFETVNADRQKPLSVRSGSSGDTAKSPLRYPGGKSRAVELIWSRLPQGLSEICSPFLGGASVELACAARGIKVYGSDAFEPVVNFWKQSIKDPKKLADKVENYWPLERDGFYELQRSYSQLSTKLQQAAVFYALNRSSFSGTTLSGGMSPKHPRFTKSSIERLRNFGSKNLHVECRDYKDALSRHKDMFLYLDPPYANGGKLYGSRGDMHEGFDHEQLAGILRKREGWILSYNDCDVVRELYKGFDIVVPEWIYGMSNDKRSKEVLISCLG